MAYLKKIQGEKSHAHSEQRKKWLKREENYNLKGKDLLLRQKGGCGAVSKDVFSNYNVSWLEVQCTCIDIKERKITQMTVVCPHFNKPRSESSRQQIVKEGLFNLKLYILYKLF